MNDYETFQLTMRRMLMPMVILLLPAMNLSAQQALSVRESVQFALKNSPQILKSRLETRKTEEKVREYLSVGYPQVNFNTGFTYNLKLPTQLIPNFFEGKPEELIPVQFGTDMSAIAGINLDQMAYDHAFWLGVKATRQLVDFNKLVEAKTEEELAYNVVRTYYQAVILSQQRDILRANLAQVQGLFRATELQYQNGFAKKVDLDQLRVNQVVLETQIKNLDLQYEQALKVLKFTLAMPIEAPIALTDTLIANGLPLAIEQEMLAPGVENKIDLQILDKQNHLLELNAERYRAGFYPSARLTAGYNFQGQGNKLGDFGDGNKWFDFSQVGLNIQIPLYDGNRKRSQIQQVNIEMLQLAEDRKQTLQSLELQHANARQQIFSYWNTLNSLQASQTVAEEVYNVTQKRFSQGVASITELLNAERTMREVQVNYLTTLLQYNLAWVDLDYANGKLMQNFK